MFFRVPSFKCPFMLVGFISAYTHKCRESLKFGNITGEITV